MSHTHDNYYHQLYRKYVRCEIMANEYNIFM